MKENAVCFPQVAPEWTRHVPNSDANPWGGWVVQDWRSQPSPRQGRLRHFATSPVSMFNIKKSPQVHMHLPNAATSRFGGFHDLIFGPFSEPVEIRNTSFPCTDGTQAIGTYAQTTGICAQSIGTYAHSTNTPGQSKNAPGHSRNSPGHRAPGHRGNATGQMGNAPGYPKNDPR